MSLFFQEHDDCPVCKQGLNEDHKTKCITERKAKSAEIEKAMSEISKTIESCHDEIQRINSVQGEIDEIQRQMGYYIKLRYYLIKSISRNSMVRLKIYKMRLVVIQQ